MVEQHTVLEGSSIVQRQLRAGVEVELGPEQRRECATGEVAPEFAEEYPHRHTARAEGRGA